MQYEGSFGKYSKSFTRAGVYDLWYRIESDEMVTGFGNIVSS